MRKPWPIGKLGGVPSARSERVQLDPLATNEDPTARLPGKGVVESGVVPDANSFSTSRLRVQQQDIVASKIDARNRTLALAALGGIEVPVPLLSRQCRVDSQLAHMYVRKRGQSKSAAEQDAPQSAALDRAFEGEL